MLMPSRLLLIGVFTILFSACSNDSKRSNRPIVLGDSTQIVTETDSKYLSDFVDDIKLQTPQPDTTSYTKSETPTKDSEKVVNQIKPATGKGLQIIFKDVTVFIAGIQTKTYRNQDLQKANGASYQLLSGDLSGNAIQLSGSTISKVSQRYTTLVTATTDFGKLQLTDLGTTTDWTPLSGNGKSYRISGLNNLETEEANTATLRASIIKAARNKRVSRQILHKWEETAHQVKTINSAPLKVSLRSVMWKIEGKDASGKAFQKQVRIDLNP
ncbi:MAG: hypothetical protein JSS64_14630 [Bacteroidetes bacterium]|nr:hypothetical protein [Bacteroidota bacterium]